MDNPSVQNSGQASTSSLLDRYREHCQSGAMPELAGFVASGPALDPHDLAALVHVDQRHRHAAGVLLPAESYFESFPMLRSDAELALDVVYQEYVLRRDAGEAYSTDKYLSRFPDLAERLAMQFTLDGAMGDGLLSPSMTSAPATEKHTPAYPPGTVIAGRYKLLEEIGEGGMGTVWAAQQTEPVRRRVALKLIKLGMDTREVITRFEAERQALALMDHPGIAHVLDAGTTEAGRPYFVMELVKGIPITDYCDQCSLTTRERLELFASVCQAVQHAHQKGIIHRDVKPSNVLVTMRDGRPAVKVIDFGVAKAINQRLTERTLITGFMQMLGTPMYMSPEQAEMGPLDVDTRSDIYSLGVLLYELLTGSTPFDKSRLSKVSYDELRRIIREEEPPKPSTRLSTLHADILSTVAEHRRTDPRHLNQQVRGDLDWIVMKSLEKDRTRRYETADALARDIKRYLNEEPVEACPPTAAYRFRKFARRNRARLLAATSVVLIILVGWGISTVLIARERNAAQAAAVEAQKERQRAEENLLKAKQAVDTWFTQVAADLEGKPHMTNVQRALLEQALEFYKGFLKQKADDSEIRRETALAYQRVAAIYTLLGRHEESAEASRVGVVIIVQLSTERPDDVDLQILLADSYQLQGSRRFFTGEFEIAAEATRKSIDIWDKLARRLPSVPHYQSKAAVTLVDLANELKEIPGKLAEAEAHCRESLARWKRFRERFPDLARTIIQEDHSHLWLALILKKAGRYAEGEQHLRSSIDLRSKFFADSPQDMYLRHFLAQAKLYLAQEVLRKGSFEESERELKSCIELLQPMVDQYPDIAEYRRHLERSYEELSLALFSQRRYAEAENASREKAALLPSEDGATLDWRCDIAWSHYNLGLIVHRQDRMQEAADLFRKAIGQFERAAAESPQDSAVHRRAQNGLHWSLATCPLVQFRDAQRALKIAKWFAQRDPLSGEWWNNMGIAHYRMGSFDQAIDAIRKSIELQGEGDSYDLYFLAMALWQRGDKEDARTWYRKAVDHKENPGGSNGPDLLNFRDEAEQLLGIPKAAPAPPDAPQGDPAKPES